MEIQTSKALLRLSDCFAKAGYPLYAVGGLVRNSLLGYPLSDTDVCGPARPEELRDILAGEPFAIIEKALDFGTVEIHSRIPGEKLIAEYTTFRKDQYGQSGQHRPEVVCFTDSLEEDAFRRDFSVNALYYDLQREKLYDPTGGLQDLKNKRIRTTSQNPDRILQDDGLRILRLVRFACELGFHIEEESFASGKRNAALLADIAKERIWQELKKILMSDVRYDAKALDNKAAHYRGIKLMQELGALYYVIPELYEGENTEQNPVYHAFTVMEHNLYSCACAAPVLSVRLAALLHDIGKPRMLAQTGKMLGHDKLGAQMSSDILKRLRLPHALVEEISKLVAVHMYDLDGRAKTKTLKKRFVQMGVDLCEKFILLREADFVGSGKQNLPVASAERFKAVLGDMIQSGAIFSERELAIGGREIQQYLGIEAGPLIGELKKKLFLHCAIYPKDNSRGRLLNLLPGVYKQCLMQEQAEPLEKKQ